MRGRTPVAEAKAAVAEAAVVVAVVVTIRICWCSSGINQQRQQQEQLGERWVASSAAVAATAVIGSCSGGSKSSNQVNDRMEKGRMISNLDRQNKIFPGLGAASKFIQ